MVLLKIFNLIILFCFIFVILSIAKFGLQQNDYHQFLIDAYDYNTQILNTMDELESQGLLKEALKYGKQSIKPDKINSWWFINLLNWTESAFATTEILEKLNYWRKTEQIPMPKNSKTDYEKGIQSV